MARRIPHVADGVLYAQGPPGVPDIAVDSPAWAAWLEDRATHSFSFEGPSGTFTARKEHRSGSSEEYWSAYRKQGGKLRKVYLGKTEKLTLVRLDAAAAKDPTTSNDHVWERPRKQAYDVDSRQLALTPPGSEGEAVSTSLSTA